MNYKGSCLLVVDEKGRIAIPSQFRASLKEQCQGRLVATCYLDDSIVLYPWPIWERVEEDLSQLPGGDPANRRVRELIIGNADERQLDKQHRLLLAPALREHAKLERDAKLMGVGEKLLVRSQQTDRDLAGSVNDLLNDPERSRSLAKVRF